MDFKNLLKLVGEDPIFESSLLLSGDIDPRTIRLQLSRWVKNGRIQQIRKGLYTLAPPYRKIRPHPFLIANRLHRASYVSMQSALAYYGMIPEIITSTISVSTGRPERLETPLGVFEFRHIKTEFLFGYQMLNIGGQNALVAYPEKALLDLIYLLPGADSPAYLSELRLQNLESLDINRLEDYSKKFRKKKVQRAFVEIAKIINNETSDYEDL